MPLLRDGINEVIATTKMNAAPIGIISRAGKIRMILYRGSHTVENIARDGWVVANFTFDPVVWVTTAFCDLPAESFVEEVADGTRVQRLASVEAWAAFRATPGRRTRDTLVVELALLREESPRVMLHPVNRGWNSLLEATIHGTRYRMKKDDRLADLIEYHAGIVKKCGGPREIEALGLLFDYSGYP